MMPISAVLHSIISSVFLASIIRISTPIVLPALGGLISELAGVVNISLEGIMLVAAFFGVVVSAYSRNAWAGVVAGATAGLLASLLLAYFHLYLRANIILAGMAINVMCGGGTTFLLYVITGDKGSSSTLVSGIIPSLHIPVIEELPVLGSVLSGHNVLTYVAFLLTFLVHILLYHTPFGVHLRAVGENPDAAASAGIKVRRTRLWALCLSGLLASLGGLNLSMAYLTLFQRDMTAGRGFIALAAVFLGARRPWGVLLASAIFGFADALSNQLGSLKVAPQWIQMIPYVATLLALVAQGLRYRVKLTTRARRFSQLQLRELRNSSDIQERGS